MVKAEVEIATKTLAFLEAEKQALLSGKIFEIEKLLEQKEHLMAVLSENKAPIQPEALEKIRGLATENQALYQAALSGLKSVSDRLKNVISVSEGLTTYGNDGRLRTRVSTSQAVEKRV